MYISWSSRWLSGCRVNRFIDFGPLSFFKTVINAAAAVFCGRNYEEDDYYLATADTALADAACDRYHGYCGRTLSRVRAGHNDDIY